ncbi:MAG: ABC transporter substrate-binding protein [Magnetococcales bacterium]|nr:ABC transporter substrate-binding protein [Magnetococcales bacterium]
MKKCSYYFTVMFLLSTFFVPCQTFAQSIDDLVFITENYAPFNYEKDGKAQGIAVDLLVKILERSGSKKSRKDFKVLPWSEGYRLALSEKNVVLFSTLRTKKRDSLFKWVGPIKKGSSALIAKKSRNIQINTLNDLNKYITGVVRDDASAQSLINRGVNPKNIYETVSGTGGQNLGKMLAANRIDLWAYSDVSASRILKMSGFSFSDYEVVYNFPENDVYFALNINTDDKIVAKLQKLLDYMRDSGEIQKIIKNYLPNYQFEQKIGSTTIKG